MAFVGVALLLAFAMPPFQVPDEINHWATAVVRTEKALGQVKGQEEVCSTSLAFSKVVNAEPIRFQFEQKVTTGGIQKMREAQPRCEKDVIQYGSVLTYFPVAVWSLFVSERNVNGESSVALFYLSRLGFGLLIAGLLFRLLAISGVELHERKLATLSIFAFALSPLFVQQSIGISADGVVNAFALSLAILMIAGHRLRRGDWIAAFALGVIAATSKPVIAPLGVLVPILFYSQKERRNRKDLQWAIALAVAVAGVSVLYFFKQFGFSKIDDPYQALSGVSSRDQLQFVLAHPGVAIRALGTQVLRVLSIDEWVGPLGWLDTGVHKLSFAIWKTLFLAALAIDFGGSLLRIRPAFFRSREAWVLALGSLAILSSLFATVLALYLGFTPVGSGVVGGVQIRYFFPQIIVFLGLAHALRSRADAPPALVGTGPRLLQGLLQQQAARKLLLAFAVGIAMIYLVTLYLSLAVRYW